MHEEALLLTGLQAIFNGALSVVKTGERAARCVRTRSKGFGTIPGWSEVQLQPAAANQPLHICLAISAEPVITEPEFGNSAGKINNPEGKILLLPLGLVKKRHAWTLGLSFRRSPSAIQTRVGLALICTCRRCVLHPRARTGRPKPAGSGHPCM